MSRKKVVLGLGYIEYATYQGIVSYAKEAHWHLDNSSFHTGVMPSLEGADGLITMHGRKPDVIAAINEANVPVVDTGGDIGMDVWRVNCDNIAIGQKVAEHFINRGFQRLAFVSSGFHPYFESLRLQGFKSTVVAAGRDFILLDFKGGSFKQWLVEMLAGLELPTAVMTTSDVVSDQLVSVALANGVRIPEELAVIGVKSDEEICELAEISLSHIDNNAFQVGYQAANLLDRLMEGETVAKQPLLLPPGEIVVRQSSDILAVAHPAVAQAMAFIWSHFCEPINVGDVLAVVDVTPAALHRAFRHALGRTILEEITRLRIEKGTGLLVNTKMKVKEIAQQCGFSSSLRMGQVFRREIGRTPSQVRSAERQLGK